VLQALRARIRSIERRTERLEDTGECAAPTNGVNPEAWTLGAPALDGVIGPAGLEAGAVHEIKPGTSAGWAAGHASACRFAMGLAVRRLASAPRHLGTAPILFCTSAATTAEAGAPYLPGLAALGLPGDPLLLVEAAKPADALWALEEGLKSGALALAVALLDDVGLTPARRLALAAAETRTPCLLLTSARSPGTAATSTRWRIGPAASAPNPLDGEAPGLPRFEILLERCRSAAGTVRSVPCLMEWCDAAYRFRVAAGVADRTAHTGEARGRPLAALGPQG
jgi:protein ImuA